MKLKWKLFFALMLATATVVLIEPFWKAQATPDIPKHANPGDVAALMGWDPILGEMRLLLIDTAGGFVLSGQAASAASIASSTALSDDFSVTTSPASLELILVNYSGAVTPLYLMVFDAVAQPSNGAQPVFRFGPINVAKPTTFALPFGGTTFSVGVHLVLSSTEVTLTSTAETATFAGWFR